MKKQIILLLVVLMAVPALAQKQDRMREGGPEKKKEMNEEKRKEIEAQRVAYITTQLNLTTEESKAFWPVYNEYQTATEEHRKEKNEFKKPMKNMSELTDEEVDELLQAQFKYEHESIEIEELYYDKFKEVLPVKKVADFYEAERGFKKELLKSLRGKQNRGGSTIQHPAKGERIAAPQN